MSNYRVVIGAFVDSNSTTYNAGDLIADTEPLSGIEAAGGVLLIEGANNLVDDAGDLLIDYRGDNKSPGAISIAEHTQKVRHAYSELPTPGTNIPDSTGSLNIVDGVYRIIQASTLSTLTARTGTLSTTGARKGNRVRIVRLDTGAQAYTVANGGGGGGNVAVLPGLARSFIEALFDGTNWKPVAFGSL